MTPSTGTRREEFKAQTRRLILDTAYELFAEKGYAKATMRELAARAGVGLGTIFQHFPDKSALLLAAFNDDMTSLARKALTTLPPTNLRDQAEHLVRPVLGFYAARPELAREILKEGLFAVGETNQRLLAQENQLSQGLAELYRQAIERGELRPDLDLALAAKGFWAIYISVLIMGLRTGRFETEQLVGELMGLFDHLMAGMAPPPG